MVALGCMSEARGDDSAGVAWVEDGKPDFLKIAQNPFVAFPVTLYPAIRSAVRAESPIIGHTRQATTGAVTSDNAHPFLDDGIVFAHNGVILNHAEFGKYEVDSQCLIHGIRARDFSKFDGPIALVWIENGKLHAMRNRNPLYRGVRKDAIYLASDEDYLKDIECRKIRSLSEGYIYTWDGIELEAPKAVPINKETIIKGFRKFEDYMPEYVNRGHSRVWQSGKHWDNEKQEFVFDGEVSLIPRETSIPIEAQKPEAESLAEVDAQAGEGDSLIDEELARINRKVIEVCDECKENPRVPASFYCELCLKRGYSWMSGRGD